MSKRFVIRFKRPVFADTEDYVAGFDAEFGCVQRTSLIPCVRVFSSKGSAKTFINVYSGAGYGISDNDVVIEEMS